MEMNQNCFLADIMNEDQIELDVLKDLPSCFLITGKPGCGKSTLARNLATIWKCNLINDTSVLEEAITEETDLGIKAMSILKNGEQLSEEFMAEIINQKLQSPALLSYGYVMDCLPSMCEEWKSVEKQIEYIQKLSQKPTVIINLRISDQELEIRRLNLKIDALSQKICNCAKSNQQQSVDQSLESQPDESEEEEEAENESEENEIFEDDVGTLDDDFFAPSTDLRECFVRRPRDIINNVDREIQFYNDHMLKPLESFFGHHNKKYFIELDANLTPKELMKSLLIHLDSLGLSCCPVPLHLFNPEEDEDDDIEGFDNEEFFQRLADKQILLPKFRWRCSKWGRYCPVELARGNLIHGKLEFSVGFHDKAYCLSSAEALRQFTLNPKSFLLPPLPQIPCKICILGPPTSGKSTLAKMLSQHYNAMVLNIQLLLTEVIEKQKEQLIKDAKLEAINNIKAKNDGTESQLENHPDVIKAVDEATANISVPISQGMYMDALKNGIVLAETRRREEDPGCPKFGGWIIDSFPMTRENWTAMIDNELLPDFVISLEDDEASDDFLLERFKKIHNLQSPIKNEEDIKVSEVITKWQSARSDYVRQWSQLLASIKGSAIDPIVIDCSLPIETVVSTAIKSIQDVFSFQSTEYSFMDADADADDDPDLNDSGDTPDEDLESSEASRIQKPWGDSHHFCPVILRNDSILWPGDKEISSRYREKVYCFSSEDAKVTFSSNPMEYTSISKPFKLPPLRIFLLGSKSAGKTTIGRYLAEKFDVFHISFRDLLQEEILPKVKKPPLVDDDEWDEKEQTGEDEKEVDLDMDSDLKMPLTSEEADIRSYLCNESNLSEEAIQKYLEAFWSKEPYKSTGFVLEGFPYKSDEMRFLAEKGWYPDAVVILQVEESTVISRILPFRLETWKKKRNMRMAKRKLIRDTQLTEWEADKEHRKAELKSEYDKNVAANSDEDKNNAEALYDEYIEQLSEINEEDPPEAEEEEEEETEIEAVERMKTSIIEHFEEQNESISLLQEVFSELQVPCHSINGSRKPGIVKFSVEKYLLPYTCNRQGLLTKCTPVNADIAKKLLNHGYKYLSPFKKWCPVKLLEDSYSILPPRTILRSQQFPVIYRQHIYFPSSSSNRNKFMDNPHKYITQLPPGPAIPVTMSIVGPPKSGKTTVAKRFCLEYGCIRLSIGEALRRMIAKFPQSKLTELIESHLRAGQSVPEDLSIHALESALLDVQCCTRGFILDGLPATKSQVDLLSKFQIVPISILELDIDTPEILKRGENDRHSLSRLYPAHDSDSILLVRSKNYQDNIGTVRNWYSQEHDNWHTIEGFRSRWRVWNECERIALFSAKQTQQYLARITPGKAASLNGLCLTPSKFQSALGEFQEYCPVNLANGKLIDCSSIKSLKFAAEYRGKYYKMHSQEDLQLFLRDPDNFLHPKAPYSLPPSNNLPRRKSHIDIKTLFPKQFEVNGFCSVCYIDGNKRYECLLPGDPELSVEFCEKIYCFCSEFHLERFMRQPIQYEISSLPAKLPPLKQASPITSLPMLGYMEQAMATAIIDSLSAIGSIKPKFPFLSSTKSALLYIGLYLKAFNPRTNKLVQQKYKKKLITFENQCKLIDSLSFTMKSGYKDPLQRPIQFNTQINSFLYLKDHGLSVHT